MNRREIREFTIDLGLELIKHGYIPEIIESHKSNSVYVSDIQRRFVVRISDHGGPECKYNFTPRKGGNPRKKEGCLYFPMDNAGITAFIGSLNKDIININQINNNEIIS